MYQILSVVIGIAVFIVSFWSPTTSWIVIAAAIIYVTITSWALGKPRYSYLPQLSANANFLIQKHGHIYKWGFAAQDLSIACGPLSVASLAIGIVSGFKSYYWGIAFAVVGIVIFGMVARYLNPIRFLKPNRFEDAILLNTHKEIVEFLTKPGENPKDK